MSADNKTTRWRLAHLFAIPGTGKRRPYCWLRNPRHIGVERALAAFGLRGEKVPPDAYDDISRSVERSWKAHRKTRWHETAP